MYHNGMIPKCFIVEETVTKNGMFEGKFLTVFRFDQAHWMRRFIEDEIVKATAQFGDNYNLETGQFGNGAKVTITYKPKDASRIADTIEAYCPCRLPETVAHVKLEDDLGTERDWQIYCQDEEVPGANG